MQVTGRILEDLSQAKGDAEDVSQRERLGARGRRRRRVYDALQRFAGHKSHDDRKLRDRWYKSDYLGNGRVV